MRIDSCVKYVNEKVATTTNETESIYPKDGFDVSAASRLISEGVSTRELGARRRLQNSPLEITLILYSSTLFLYCMCARLCRQDTRSV